MTAAPIQWRPLGQMLVDRGLLTPDELEEVLRAQQQSGRPLGQIVVDRGLISGPTLALTLAEQCGVELETDTGFGTGLWSAIQLRHRAENRRRADLHVVPAQDEPDSETASALEQDDSLDLSAEAEEPGLPIASPAARPADAEPRVIELEQALQERNGRVAALEAAEHTHRQELEQLSKELAEANARVVELEEALYERQRRVEALEAEQHARAQELEQLSKQLEKRHAQEESNSQIESQAAQLKREQNELASERRALEGEQNAITKRAGEVREGELALEARAAELAERERELDARMQQVEAASGEIGDRERDLAEREQAMAGRQRAVLTAAADLEQLCRALEERERALALRGGEHEQKSDGLGRRIVGRVWGLGPPHEVVSPPGEVGELTERDLRPVPAPEGPSPAGGYRWNIDTLSRMVEERADEFPDRVDDWRYTLFYLRNEAHIDGALPRNFDSLVEECFGELLAVRDRVPVLAAGTVSPGSPA
jgi:hypothetical protein